MKNTYNKYIQWPILILTFLILTQPKLSFATEQSQKEHAKPYFVTANTWPWKKIEKSKYYPARGSDFPPGFIWGAGTSAYQVESDCTNSSYANWTQPRSYKEPAGIGCDHNNRYKEDIKLMANELKINADRFSVERSKIEPQPGQFDEKQLALYADICRELIKNGIRPVIGFHHYSDPQWFIDRGGFANKENIDGFVKFCTRVFQVLNAACLKAIQKNGNTAQPANLMPMYLTFNSPSSYAVQGYLRGERPPGQKDIMSMAKVLRNMLEAHVRAYQAIKQLPDGESARIGITHNVFQMDPYSKFNPIHKVKCHYATKLVHDCVLDFFATGDFKVAIPFKVTVQAHNNKAPKSLDFIGLNYYSHGLVGAFGNPIRAAGELHTDNKQYTIYAEGLYRAIADLTNKLTKKISIPIYVTENGIGTNDDNLRDLFLKRYMFALAQAIADGYDVRGYIHWSFMDNYEWGTYNVRYGLYYVDRTPDPKTGKPVLTRHLKKGAQYFVDLINDHREYYKIS